MTIPVSKIKLNNVDVGDYVLVDMPDIEHNHEVGKVVGIKSGGYSVNVWSDEDCEYLDIYFPKCAVKKLTEKPTEYLKAKRKMLQLQRLWLNDLDAHDFTERVRVRAKDLRLGDVIFACIGDGPVSTYRVMGLLERGSGDKVEIVIVNQASIYSNKDQLITIAKRNDDEQ